MAKKNDAAFDAFLADLKAIAPGIEDLIKDDNVKTKLREGVLARSEFSTQMDSLKTERETFTAEVTEARKRIEGWQKWYGDATQQVASTQDELKKYKDEFGELDGTVKRKVAGEQGLTVDEFQKRLNEEINKRDIAALKFADDLTDIKIDYKDRFKEKLDTTAVYKLAGEKGVSLDVAYNLFIADKVEDQRKVEFDTQLKAAREEGAREALASHKLPIMSNISDVTHVLDIKDAPRTEKGRVDAAVAGFFAGRK